MMKSQKKPQPKFWQNSKFPIAIAHRGGDAAGIEKENSMKAFQAAYDLGYRWFETDVVSTLDDKLLAIHGRGFQLRPNKDLPLRFTIQRTRYKTIQQKTIGGEPIALLEDLITKFPDVKLIVDPKTSKAAKALIKVLCKYPTELDRICVGSFFLKRNLKVRRRVKRITGVEICTYILGPVSAWPIFWSFKFKPLKPFAKSYIRNSKAHSMHIPYAWMAAGKVEGKTFVDYVHELGLLVAAYTPNGEDSIGESLQAGVDVVISDNSVLLMRMMERQ